MASTRMRSIFSISLLIVLVGTILTTLCLYSSIEVSLLSTSYPMPDFSTVPIRFEIQTEKPAHWTSLNEMSQVLKGAITVTEDWSFYQHSGVDLEQLKVALVEIFTQGKVRGASTITQQMVKTIYLTEDRTLWRKYYELILALKAEAYLKKDRILEVYLNSIEFGPGIMGVRAASEHYFKKLPSLITAREAAFLAMLLPSPVRYYESFQKKQLTAFAKEKVNSILIKMRMAKVISMEDFERVKNSKFDWE